jgi:hypothetical protein
VIVPRDLYLAIKVVSVKRFAEMAFCLVRPVTTETCLMVTVALLIVLLKIITPATMDLLCKLRTAFIQA